MAKRTECVGNSIIYLFAMPLAIIASSASAQTATVVTAPSGLSLVGLSDDGTRLGLANWTSLSSHMAFWDLETGYFDTQAQFRDFRENCLSGDGHYIVGSSRQGRQPFIADDEGSITLLPKYLSYSWFSLPTGISNGGTAMIGFDSWDLGRTPMYTHWYWTASGGYQLPPISANYLSGDGTMVGNSGLTAAIHRNGTTTLCPSPNGIHSSFISSNYDASVCGGSFGNTPALFMAGSWVPLPLAPQTMGGEVTDVNADGTAALIRYWTGTAYAQPYLWTASDGLRPLNDIVSPLGFDLAQYRVGAYSMSDDARVFAISLSAFAPGSDGFVLYVTIPAPGPSGALLGILFATSRRRRTQG